MSADLTSPGLTSWSGATSVIGNDGAGHGSWFSGVTRSMASSGDDRGDALRDWQDFHAGGCACGSSFPGTHARAAYVVGADVAEALTDSQAQSSQAYTTLGGKWGSSGSYGTSGDTVTWSVVGAGWGDSTYLVDGSGNPDTFFTGTTVSMALLRADFQSLLTQAFAVWSAAANITFQFVADAGGDVGAGNGAHIRIAAGYIDGGSGSNILAATIGPGFRTALADAQNGDMVFDSGNTWSSGGFLQTAIHEIGHAVGLGHSAFSTSVMYAFANGATALHADDIAGIRAIYGAPAPGDLDVRNDSGKQATLSAASAVIGTSVTLTYTLDNLGAGGVGASTVGIYRSTDATFSAGDVLVTSDAVGALGANGSITRSVTVSTTGWTSGTWYLFAVADSGAVAAESNEANNASNALLLAVAPPIPMLSIAALSADKLEGHSGTTAFTFLVTRSANTSGTSSATWTLEHVSTDALDISGLLTGSVTFAAGETSKTITISVRGDALAERDETFTIRLSSPVQSVIGTAAATGVIRGDDSSVAGVFSAANDAVTLATNNGMWFALDGNDQVTGTATADTISGGNGSDVIYGRAGDDIIDGGEGGDTLFGEAGADHLTGGGGNDYVWFDAQDTSLAGGAGYDYLIAADNADHTLNLATAGFETIIGGAGVDTFDLTGMASSSLVIAWGGAGNDRITLGATTGYAYGQTGNDVLIGGAAIDVLIGNEGADTLMSGGGNDVLWVDGQDTIDGGAGIDWAILFTAASDTLVVRDQMNVEVVAGNIGNDVIDARATTRGHHIWGSAGNDTLYSGSGSDNFYGGADADTFVFGARFGLDQIWDWQDGLDKLSFAGSGFASGQISVSASGATAIVTNTSTGDQIYVHGASGRINAGDMIF